MFEMIVLNPQFAVLVPTTGIEGNIWTPSTPPTLANYH